MDATILVPSRHSARPRLEWQSLVELLRSRAQTEGSRRLYTFLSDGATPERSLSYAELDQRARAIGACLQNANAAGQRLLLLFPPGLDYIAAFFGCLYANAIAVPAYPPRQNRNLDRLRTVVYDARPTIALTTRGVINEIESSLDDYPDLKALRWIAADSVETEWAEGWRDLNPDPGTLAFLQYTSGSTANPKGVMVSHGNLLHNEGLIQKAFDQSPSSIIVGWLPLFHDMGLIGNVIQPLYAAAECVLFSPMSFLQRPFRWLETISRYRATTSGGPNFAYDLCARKIGLEDRETLDLSSWAIAFNGAEPVRRETLDRFCEAFEPCGFRREAFFPCYGLAEATLFVAGGPGKSKPVVHDFQRAALDENRVVAASSEDRDGRSLVGCGQAPEQQVVIVDPESSALCDRDQVGEIWVSSESVAQGYWNQPEESSRIFKAHLNTGEGPYLRTGDLGFIDGGQLYLTGRLKDLIIIRGRNCYPEDIEHTIGQCGRALRPGEGVVFSADIAGDERLVVVHEVARGYRGDDLPKIVDSLRRSVAEEHDLQLFHVALIQPGTLLRTSSGKSRRQAMKKAFLDGKLRVLYQWRHSQEQQIDSTETAPLDLEATKEWIAARVAAVVGLSRVEVDCNEPIVRYGMDSLACMELIHAIEANLGVPVPVTTLLSNLSVTEIAQRVFEQLGPIGDQSIAEPAVVTPETAFPLSDGQAALWFLHRLAPQSAAYNVLGAARIRGGVDVAILRNAFQTLLDRHPMLRARFETRGGEPVQLFQESAEHFFQEVDLSTSAETDLRRRVAEEARRPFNLETGPVTRLTLFHEPSGDRLLLLAAHHIVIDMWSVAVLVKELKSMYEAGASAALSPVEFSYRDFVSRQQKELAGPRGLELQRYWQKELSGELPVLNLHTDHARPYLQTFAGAAESIRLNSDTAKRLHELARENLLSIHSVLLAAYAALLHRHSSQEEVIVGCPTSGRTDRRFHSLVGYFVNPVPIRIRLDGAMTFQQLLVQVRETVQRAFAHQDYPFARMVEDVGADRDPSRSPVFQTAFVFEQPPLFIDRSLSAFVLGAEQAQIALGPLTLESVRIDQASSQFDLSMLVAPFEEELLVALQYNTNLFKKSTIERMLGHFNLLVEEVTAQPDKRVSDLRLLTEREQEQLLTRFNDTHSEYTQPDYLHQLFEAQAEKTPEAIGLLFEGGAISYGELNAKANRLARHLRALRVVPDARVAILLPRSPDMIVAMLAVLKAGGAYVPLDPAYPADRLSFMLADSEAQVLISRETLAHQLGGHRATIINLDREAPAIARHSAGNLQPCLKPQNLSHVIYTSGSTGRPKGVAIGHENVIHFLHWAHQTFSAEELSAVFASTSICFDLSVFEIFAPLTCGGTIILASDALQLATHSAATPVTLINTVPSAMTELLRMGAVSPEVLTINLAGEALKNSLVQQIYAETNVRRVLNLYGPTEYTTYSTGVEVQRGSSSEPTIGRPVANTRVHIVNEYGEPVPLGVAGEICIGGHGLARCYLNRPGLTAERFIPDNLSLTPGSRLYRTGDVGRYLENGEIEYLGRKDHQIKLRGYRIELGEIESALSRHPEIKEAVAVAREDHLGEKQLVAYLVFAAGQTVTSDDDLRQYLRKTLPGFMVPQFFVTLASIPLTSNGKVDRLSLPAPEKSFVGERVRPLGPIEEVVANIWSEVLDVKQIGATDNFFDVGGQSLKAVQVVARLSDVFRVELPVATVFESPTVRGLAGAVERSVTRAKVNPIERVSRDGPLPLSFAQQRLWFLQRLEPASATYNVSFSARFAGPLNLPAIEQGINEILRRHEALRTTFTEVNGEPMQVIAPSLVVWPSIISLDHLDQSTRQTEMRRLLRAEARRPFDLEHGPLLRTLILRLSEDEYVVGLSMHHAISDGWSGGVFVRELVSTYDAVSAGRPSPLPVLKIQYADFAQWQRKRLQEDDFESQLSYWRKQLSAIPQLDLPTTRTRPPVRSEHGSVLRFNLPEPLVDQLRALSRRNGATLFMTLLAAFQALLSRYSGQTDVPVGTPVANRSNAEIEPLIGCFVNTLVLRTDLSGNPSFKELLARVRNVSLGAYTHSEVPFERLVSELQPDRDLSRTPLFQVMMVLQNTPPQPLVLGDLHCEIEEIDNETAKFDLTVQLTEGHEGLAGKWEYSTDLFDDATVARVMNHFRVLLEGLVENEHCRISELPILTGDEQRQLQEFNDTQHEVVSGNYLHHFFEAQVEKTPDAIALVYEAGNLSYRELNRSANRLAGYLRHLSVGPETRVALLLERSPEMIVGMLAVLKAGGAYLPLDLNYPAERLSFMLDDTRASVLICNEEARHQFPKHGAQVVSLDRDCQLIAEHSSENLVSRVEPKNLSHVIYTSGSTGRPKGVAIEHRSVISFLDWARNTFSETELAGVFASTSICFDLSVFEIFAPLTCGGAVILGDDALQLATHSAAERVTLINTVPSAMVELLRLRGVTDGALSINLAGEALKRSLVRDIYSQTRVELVRNLYGPSEYTTYSTLAELESDCDAEPCIGRPIANTQTYILDQAMSLMPIGITGEIYIGGHGLARGYLNRPDLTAERFLPDGLSGKPGSLLYRTGDLGKYLEDGNIEYLGRRDHQVKIRGYRIELGEIETALEQHDSVREAVVTVAAEQRLVAYIVSALPGIDRESVEAELRRSLNERLPSYMAPGVFVFLDHLPLTANGKVDRRALPAPERFRPDFKAGFVEAGTLTEQVLAQIWSEVLQVERIGVDDNFFDLGGHSLLAAQVVSRVRAAFQIDLPLRRLFEAPTIKTLAGTIDKQAATARANTTPIDPVSRDAALPLSFAQQRLWFLDQLEPNNAAYNISMALRLEGALNNKALEESLVEIVRRHEVLRTGFVAQDGPPRQVIEPEPSLKLQSLDLTGLPATAREDRARRLFHEQAQRPFNLSTSGLLRLTLVKLQDDLHWLLLVAHHIIGDGWSVGIFTRELAQLYRAYSQGQASPLPECSIQYADFSAWQRNWLAGKRLADELGYWKEQLAGAPARLELPTDHPRPARQSFRGAEITFALSSTLRNDLKTLCRTNAVTPFMALTAAFALLLARYSCQSDVCIGTPVAGRTRLETEDLIGLFVNTLVLRTRFNDDLTVRDLLAQVRETTLQAHAHQDLPFEKLVDELQPERTLSYSPLFQAMFVLQNTPGQEFGIEGLNLDRIDAEAETARFDLTLQIEERAGEFTGSLNYNSDLFERETIGRMTRHFQQVLASMVQNTEQQVSEVRMLSDEEREQLAVEWNRREHRYEVAGDLMAAFERAVKHSPDAIALKDGDAEVSYRELNRRANKLGHYLRRHGVGREVRVGLLLDRSVEMVVSILGVLKAGGVYVPLELSAPAERIAFMLEDAGCALLLTEKRQLELSGDQRARSKEVLALDELSREIAAGPESDLLVPVSEANTAYVIYTSGSTGRPKGVMVTHENVLRLLNATEHWYAFGARDVWTMFHSYAFDVSVWELWGALLYGGRLVMVPYWVSRTPEAYYDLLRREQVTVLNQTPSAFRQLQPLLEAGSAGQLRLVIFAGEALELNTLKSWYERYGDEEPQLVNMYGITETTVHTTYRPLRQMDVIRGRGSMVGRRIPDLELYLLDERREPVPIGVPGELYVGGRGVARGYLNRPELTAERFIPHPFSATGGERLYRSGDLARYVSDGDVEYIGRIDHQVKIRGYRIETGEIEAVLASYPGVRKAVVIPREHEPGHKYLAAYVTGDGGPRTDGLRNYLEAKLPAYMVPSALMWVDSIKLTTNGKVDRRSLPEPVRESDDNAYVAPSSPAERILAAIWQDVLSVERVGVNDNFFELGGDSILTTHVVAAARRAGLRLTPQQFFQQQMLGRLALVAEEALPVPVAESATGGDTGFPPANLSQKEINNLQTWTEPGNVEETYPLTSFQQGILFHVLDQPSTGVYLNQQSYTLQGDLDVAAFQKAFQEVVNRHQILRTAFLLSAQDGPLQMVLRQVDLAWAMYDWRDLPAAEAGEHLALLQQAEYELGFELSRAPLMRMTLVRRETELYEFIWSYHLLLLDGASGAVVFKELLEFYKGFRSGKRFELEPPVRYGDYINWLQKQEQREAESYWRQALARFSAPTPMGFDRTATTDSVEHKGYKEKILIWDEAHTSELRSFAARTHLTLNTLTQGAWALLLSRRSGSDDIVFGSTVSGRVPDFPGAESTVGLFVNVLPVRVRVPRDRSLVTWLTEFQVQQAEARRFEYCSLPEIQGWSEVPRGQPLFDSVLIFQNIPLDIALSESVGLKVLAIKSTERTNVPLALIVEPGKQLRFKIVYQSSRFDDVTIDRIIENLQRILLSMTSNSEAPLPAFPLRDAEKNLLIESFNQSF